MEKVRRLLEEMMQEEMVRGIISNPRKKADAGKRIVRPFDEKGVRMFQFEEFRNNQVFHSNQGKDSAIEEICELLETTYKQLDLECINFNYSILVSKKGVANIKKKKNVMAKKLDLSHNRVKKYILNTEKTIPFLVDLGVQTQEGKIVDKKQKKFRQINRFLEFVQDILPELPVNRKIKIIDFGCGKSYLTFAVYHYLKIMNHRDVEMIGLDLKKDVIRHCNQLAEKYGYDDLKFLVGDIGNYEGTNQVDLVITLHACDTATDYAMEKAIRWNARAILSVPCCQHEMNQQIQSDLLEPLLKYGILKERFSALLTDALRANLLEQNGYDVQILEFIDMEHTPKNLLIRAVKNGKKHTDGEYDMLCESLNAKGTLHNLLQND